MHATPYLQGGGPELTRLLRYSSKSKNIGKQIHIWRERCNNHIWCMDATPFMHGGGREVTRLRRYSSKSKNIGRQIHIWRERERSIIIYSAKVWYTCEHVIRSETIQYKSEFCKIYVTNRFNYVKLNKFFLYS